MVSNESTREKYTLAITNLIKLKNSDIFDDLFI